MMKHFLFVLIFLCILGLLVSCDRKQPNEVVAYVALDREYSEPILQRFTRETGIPVRAVYDAEATKTVGLANRLIVEANRPRCDVYWNNEILQTLRLKKRGILASYMSSSAEQIPSQFRDPDSQWTGFATRLRVMVYNTDRVSEEEKPLGLLDLLNPRWKGKAAISNPLFGTMSTHTSAIFVAWGGERARDFFLELRKNDVQILEGNAVVRNEVARGGVVIGLTDSDDAYSGIQDGKPLGIVHLDQGNSGTLAIPNTISMIRDCPHPDNAKRLIDFILDKRVEAELAQSRSAQIPVRESVTPPKTFGKLSGIRTMHVDFETVLERYDETTQFIRKEFLK